MDHETFMRLAAERFGYRQQAARPAAAIDELTPADLCELMPDLLRLNAGQMSAQRAHPLAVELARERTTLEQIQQRSGLTTSDFGSALQTALSVLMVSAFTAANSVVETVCRSVDVRNFRPVKFPAISIPVLPEIEEDVDPAKLVVKITEASRSGQLRSYGARLRFSRQVFSSVGDELAAAVVDYARNVLPRLEQTALAAALEAGSWGTATGALSAAGLDAVNKALRAQTLGSGQTCNYSIFALCLPPALEMQARAVRELLGWTDLKLIVLDDLSVDTKYYAVASPAVTPVLLRLRLGPMGGRPYLSFSNADGSFQYFVGHDFDILPNSAVPGVCEVSTS